MTADYARLFREGKHHEAAEAAERACAIFREELGDESRAFAGCLSDLGLLYKNLGKYKAAKPLYERAIAIREDALGSDHPLLAHTLTNLAALHYTQGAYAEAEPILLRAVAIQERAPRGPSTYLATSLNNLAMLYRDQGTYEEAEPLIRQALAMQEEVLGPDDPLVATSLNNLAILYRDLGAYQEAKLLYEKALAINEKALGPLHPDFATSLGNLAMLYSDLGAHEEAEPLYERALAVRESALGPRHPMVAVSLDNLAGSYRSRGAHEKAELLYERALAIHEEALGPDHPFVSASLNNLAGLYFDQSAYERAEPLYERALSIAERTLGPHHPSVATCLRNLARLHHAHGNHDLALNLDRRALHIEEVNLIRTLSVAEEPRRLAYASTLSGSLNSALSIHLRVTPENKAVAELALLSLLRRKHRVQDLTAQSKAELRRSVPEGNQHLLDDIADVDSQIAVLANRDPLTGRKPDDARLEMFKQRLNQLEDEREVLWRELANHSPAVQTLEQFITIEDVQRSLANGSVFIEFALYTPIHGDDGKYRRSHEPALPPRYAAYVVFPDHFDWVDLGPAAPIDENIKAFRMVLQTRQAVPTDLYDALLRPIVEKFDSAHHLIVAPAGNLSLIPFGALYNGMQYLVEKYELRYVTTGRDLLPPPVTPPAATTPVTIVANPRGANLPDAELEADFLARLFPKTRILLDGQATESNVRTIERPLVLHIATHGFFGKALNERNNPLFRSGLYMADIDQVEVDRTRDDGRLTAYEVSGMDLRGTQLVVLSACNTGLGTAVKAEGKELMSEGVAGLRRAFAVAGARTIVMSLWEVSGVTTQQTMKAYYRKLAEGMGRGQAMQAVQIEMLRTEEHAHPKDWAAFIVSGDDTPMMFREGERPRKAKAPQGPPPVRRPHGCAVAASSSEHDRSVPAFLLGLLGLGVLRRRRASPRSG